MKAETKQIQVYSVDKPICDAEFQQLVEKLEYTYNDDATTITFALPEQSIKESGMSLTFEVNKDYGFADYQDTESLAFASGDVKVYVPLTERQMGYLDHYIKEVAALCYDQVVEERREARANYVDDLEHGVWGYGY